MPPIPNEFIPNMIYAARFNVPHPDDPGSLEVVAGQQFEYVGQSLEGRPMFRRNGLVHTLPPVTASLLRPLEDDERCQLDPAGNLIDEDAGAEDEDKAIVGKRGFQYGRRYRPAAAALVESSREILATVKDAFPDSVIEYDLHFVIDKPRAVQP